MIVIRILALLFALVAASSAFADRRSTNDPAADRMLTLTCGDCRDLSLYPGDGANFSLNQVWGPDSWLTPEQANMFRIQDGFGNRMTVDVNIQIEFKWYPFEYIPFTFLRFGVPWPDDLRMQIIIRDKRWHVVYKDILRPTEAEWPLMVGDDPDESSPEPDSGPRSGSVPDHDDNDNEDSEDGAPDADNDDGWYEADLEGEDCESCTAAFDADGDGELDRDQDGDLIEYEL